MKIQRRQRYPILIYMLGFFLGIIYLNIASGRYVVDAKSILGICTMDTSDGCCVKINALSTNNKIHEFEENIKNWRV